MNKKFQRYISILLAVLITFQFVVISNAAELTETMIDEVEELSVVSLEDGTATIMALDTIRAHHSDSGRWPGDSGANTSHNVDVFTALSLPVTWMMRTTSEVPIGVIDSGIQNTHEDITGSYMGGATFGGVTTADTVDEEGHGTMVAGVICGNGYNSLGSAGVCWSANVKSLKAVSIDSTKNSTEKGYYKYNDEDLIEAINYANSIGIKILNMSLGSYVENTRVKEAIKNFDGLVICGAGNNNINTDMVPAYPASYDCDNIISVGALEGNKAWVNEDAENEASNWGATTVDVFAPGCDIYTTITGTNKYDYATGTSFAAPFVTGLAALIWQADPDLSATEVKAKIMNNVDKLSSLSGKCVSGGRINAYKALRSAMTQSNPRILTGDINGDGVEDMVVSGNTNGYLRLSTFLGNSDGSFQQAQHTFSVKVYAQSDPLFIGDVNGDGYDDVVLHWVSGSKRQLMVFLGNLYGSLTLNTDKKGYNSAIGLKYNTTTNPSKSFLRDVTGDGCADFVCHMKMDNGNRGFWVYKGIKGGTGFNTTAVTTDSTRAFIESDPVFMDDVNGDGIDDLVVHWAAESKRQLLTYTSSGSGTFNTPVNLSTANTHDASLYPSKLMLGDATGDGKADFVVMWKNADGKRCILQYKGTTNSAGNATFTTGSHLLTSTRAYIEADPVYLEDVTGDGKKDVVVYWVNNEYRQMLVYKSTGSDYNEGVNYASGVLANTKYVNERYFANVNTSTAGEELVYRWNNTSHKIMYLTTFECNSNGLFTGPVKEVRMNYFPYYVYR